MGETRRTLAFEQQAWDRVVPALGDDVETAWMLLARPVGSQEGGDFTLVVRSVVDVPEEAYEVRTANALSIRNFGWLPAFRQAAVDEAVPIFVHTHPGGKPEHSEHDLVVDDQLARVAGVRTRLGNYGSLVVGGTTVSPAFAGRLKSETGGWQSVDRVRVVGERLSVLVGDDKVKVTEIFDRQVRAFGDGGQRLLGALRVGVVGAGGTGSAVIEQLVRLGVSDIVVLDPETLTDSNVTRVYGSTLADVDRLKVKIAADHGHAIGMKAVIHPIKGRVLERSVVEQLVHCDVVFGCTDDNAGRIVLTRLPQALLQLFIDCGVVIDSRDGELVDIFGRVSVVTPTSACLLCMDDINLERARAESMVDDERAQSVRERYAPELDTPDPSVVTFTTIAASFAVNEMLSRAFGYCDPEPANHVLIRVGSRAISKTRHKPRGGHRCSDHSLIGAGVQDPFLDYGWAL